jgi:alkylation response protein AidB-like acyl-CoA dehydrogenase
MPEFYADIRDLRFALIEQARIDRLCKLPKFKDLDLDTVNAILDEAFKFAKNQMAPMNAVGDSVGVTYDKVSKRVKVPEPFHETHKLYSKNGWLALAHSPEWGGQGMPYALALTASDMFFGACLSYCLNALLTSGAGHLIESFGSDELKKLYLEKIYSGVWAGTMCLTEAGAGSDVGAARTKAIRDGDHFLIEGEKIFISAGEHDLTENICHPVLARIEGAPDGTKGLSLFLVPKIRVNPDGSLGEPNDVECTGVEHKMGIHASPTCTMVFGANGKCHGYLLGEENKGMRAMFQMMNEARISVGLQGAALANAAYQLALAFARERVQGKDLRTGQDTVILNHPDVRQMLMWQKAISEGTRALLIRTAMYYDLSRAAETEEERNRYQGYLEVLTPICKAYASDQGFRSVELSLQTLGGYGYLTEYGVEQLLRDTKIASIYEGTNGIQALDLIGRKLPANGGENFRMLLERMSRLVTEHAKHALLAKEIKILGSALEALAGTAIYFAQCGKDKFAIPMVNATPFLDLFGQVMVGWLLLEQATIAFPELTEICKAKGVDMQDQKAMRELCENDSEAKFYSGKVGTAQFYARRSLSLCKAKAEALQSGDLSPLETPL